ncbi:MAG: hypothetical protein QXU60_05035 [Sulfolobales archaeon]
MNGVETAYLYPILLSLLYPLLKIFYYKKVKERSFSLVYSLAIFLPIYVDLALRILERIDITILLVASIAINYILLKTSSISFSKPLNIRDLTPLLSVAGIYIVRNLLG